MAEAKQPAPRPCKRCKATPAPYILRNDPTCRDCYVDYVEAKAGRRLGAVARETRTSAAPAPRRYLAGLSFGASSAVMARVLDGSAKFHSSAKKGSAAAAFEALVVHVDTDLGFDPASSSPSPSPSPRHEEASSSSSPTSPSPTSTSPPPQNCSPAAARLLDRYRARFPNVSFACVHLSRALRLRTVDWAALLPPSQQQRGGERGRDVSPDHDDNGSSSTGISDSERLRRFFDALPSATARADATRLLVRHILLDMALAGSYSALLLGHSTTALAALTLAEVANGRGFSVPWQVNDGPYPVRTYDEPGSGGSSGSSSSSKAEERDTATAEMATATTTAETTTVTQQHVPIFYPMREVFGAEIAQYLELSPELGELVTAAAAAALAPSTTTTTTSAATNGGGSIVSHKDLSIADVMSRYFAGVEGPYEGIVANVVRTTGKLERAGAAGAGPCGLCGMTLDERGDERWAGELGDDDSDGNDDSDGDRRGGGDRKARLCYGCKRSVHG
ncbi:Cytoplasmic tRNA 2-thiolation protein 2 [Purpureocillium takamizusanense]|uniref:Cytoplasmic tRNA 2-thiolation protein 2 n=1 Tax=Purpureocillium takamizusanense TaxID=2060973 RepID=A0A9Q8V5C5_9HYPO|nr:Cytoplasmic tRNA 2-thiolation protein 2 [Purpureocillium takamizusanense]UNI13533.1 Cytoplasmic tRNA 2-thiolation protein 2 [Purpureocillium takamizusanense]